MISSRSFTPTVVTEQGILEVIGPRLEIVSADAAMRRILGWPAASLPPSSSSRTPGGQGCRASAEGAPSADATTPAKTVHELLPEALREAHGQHIFSAVAAGELPEAMAHPRRGLPLQRADGNVVLVNMCVGLMTKVR